MELSSDSRYQKLAKTPLAQKNTMCGLQPGNMAILLGLISILIDLIPNFVIVWYIYNAPLEDNRDPDSMFKEAREERERKQRRAIMGCAMFFTCLHFIAVLALIVGGCVNNTGYFYCWFCSMIFNCFFGKFMSTLLLVLLGFKYASILVLLSVCDIPLSIAIVYCYGQVAAVERNKRYLSMTAVQYSQPPQEYNQLLQDYRQQPFSQV